MTGPGARRDLVSVIVPCYNAAPFVAETLASALAQTHPAVEIIVVDDASTDESWTVVQQVVAAHPGRVTAIRLPGNGGGSHARNRGAERARGSYLMFLDADDLVAPEALAAMVQAVEARPGDIAICRWHYLVTDGVRWRPHRSRVPFPAQGGDQLAGWLRGAWVPPCALLWTRAAYERTGGWDEALTGDDDADITMRALASGARLVEAPGAVASYRLHTGTRVSVSTDIRSQASFRSRMRVLEKLEEALEARGRRDAYRVPLGVGYYRLVPVGLATQPDLARECARRGRALAGRRAVSNNLPGRILSWLLGVEAKERLFLAIARLGIVPHERRGRQAQVRASAAGAPPRPTSGGPPA